MHATIIAKDTPLARVALDPATSGFTLPLGLRDRVHAITEVSTTGLVRPPTHV